MKTLIISCIALLVAGCVVHRPPAQLAAPAAETKETGYLLVLDRIYVGDNMYGRERGCYLIVERSDISTGNGARKIQVDLQTYAHVKIGDRINLQ